MQHIATAKSEIAALVTKVNGNSGNNYGQQQEFNSYLQQADKVYGHPDEPKKSPVREDFDKPFNEAQKKQNTINKEQSENTLFREKNKENLREHARPVEQKSSVKGRDGSNEVAVTDDKKQPANAVDTSDKLDKTDVEANLQHNVRNNKNNNNEQSETTEQHIANSVDKPTAGQQHDLLALELASEDALGQNISQETLVDDLAADEATLTDWLALVENSIAKANQGNDETTNDKNTLYTSGTSNDLSSQLDNVETVSSEDNDSLVTQIDPLLQVLSTNIEGEQSNVESEADLIKLDSVNVNIELQDVVTEEQVLASNDALLAGSETLVTTDESDLQQQATDTLNSFSELVSELQNAVNQQQDGSDIEYTKSIDQLMTEISEFVETIDPQVMDKLRDALSNEPESINAIASPTQQIEGEIASDSKSEANQDLVLMFDLLSSSQAIQDKLVAPENANTAIPNSANANTASTVQAVNTATIDLATQGNQVVSSGIDADTKSLDKSVSNLLDMPTEKLESALTHLAQRLDVKTNKGQSDATDATTKSDFVAALKSGVEEVKAQIKQGHQPAIDLSSLVTEAASKVSAMPIVPEVLDQSVTRFNQTLELTGQLNAKIEQLQHVFSAEKSLVKDNINQAQHLQTKQGQQIAQFDKAVNITRNEGLQQLTEKVRWMANQNNLQAEIRLDPPDLGGMKIRLNMSGDTASVNIVVQSAQARDVLEQQAPRLKELLEQQGIELGQSSVQQEQSEGSQQQNSEFAGSNQADEDMLAEDANVIEQRISNGRLGGIDYFV